jgi:hypothetical protein
MSGDYFYLSLVTMKKLTCLLVFNVLTCYLFAQQAASDSSLISDAAAYVRKMYDHKRNNELPIYNGLRHQLYSASLEGIPYFESLDWFTGSVVYDDVLYDSIILRYDQVKDEVIVAQDRSTAVFISLYSPRVKGFSFNGIKFIRISDTTGYSSLRSGFYQQLVKGKATVLTRNAKTIDEKIDGTTLTYVVKNNVRYYIRKDDQYHLIKNQGDLLDVLKDHRKEIQKFLSDSELKYRREPKQTIIAVTEFYNQL